MARLPYRMAAIALIGLTPLTPAAASDVDEPIAIGAIALAPPSAAPPPVVEPVSPFAGASVIADDGLATITGMADVETLQQIINARNVGTVTGNTINGNSATGNISIGGSSFDNFNGLALLNANSGNNVSINASMNVNVAVQ
ncbi:hypothetical protein SAMN06295912_10619 [Sphingomonas laterariae]|uniref:Uncharacterized protein n=1 Tax=Edaphosphingomonas laterariae TaxID=861865 RepID=A0A239E999_9SPHN|nr:hypothetical protein [Sphingomonas laterariae]SNS41041.1 hypothetical protein SAMN06295912_10619 [Sphingomonas laterariae]